LALPPKPLKNTSCYLFVLGPDVGETVALRFPQGSWVIVDSFSHDGRPAAEWLIREYGGTVDAVVLTHPHQDHYSGILELLDDHEPRIIGCVHPRSGDITRGLPVDPRRLLKERARPTYDRIWDSWQHSPERKWQTFRKYFIRVEDAQLTSLHPVPPLEPTDWNHRSINDLSSAILVQWHQLRILLGADATNDAWNSMGEEFPDLADHSVLKVPHHGSRNAIHSAFGDGRQDRVWIVTPFKRQRLPRAEEGQGMAAMLGFVNQFHLTAMPFRHDLENQTRCETTREAIRDNLRPRKLDRAASDASNRLEARVVVEFGPSGNVKEMWHGRGTVLVQR
jgi:beta-lactamase superfamily II metal-dependent hydrolase